MDPVSQLDPFHSLILKYDSLTKLGNLKMPISTVSLDLGLGPRCEVR